MNKKVFNIIGWILLLGIAFLWLAFGHLDLYLLFIPAAYVCFSISDGSIKNLKKVKMLSFSQIMVIVFTFIVSIGIVLGLILLAGYLIDNIFNLHGWMKTVGEYIAVILALFPGIIVFASVTNKIDDRLNVKHMDSLEKTYVYNDLVAEANEMLKSMTEIQTIKSLRKKHNLSLVDAKKIVDDVE